MNKTINIKGLPENMIANNLVIKDPTHPGEFLREEIEYRGITQTKLAHEIGVRVSLLNEIINGKRDITTEYALMLEAALGIDADYWINLQTNYNKARIRQDHSFMSKLSGIRRLAAMI